MELNAAKHNVPMRGAQAHGAGNVRSSIRCGVGFVFAGENNFETIINSPLGVKFMAYLKKKNVTLWRALADNGRKLKGINAENRKYLFELFDDFHVRYARYNTYIELNSVANVEKALRSQIGYKFLWALAASGYKAIHMEYKSAGFAGVKDQVFFVHLFNEFFNEYNRTGKCPKTVATRSRAPGVKKRVQEAKLARVRMRIPFDIINEYNFGAYITHPELGAKFAIYLSNANNKAWQILHASAPHNSGWKIDALNGQQKKYVLKLFNNFHIERLDFFVYDDFVRDTGENDDFQRFYRILQSPYGQKFLDMTQKQYPVLYAALKEKHYQYEKLKVNHRHLVFAMFNQFFKNKCKNLNFANASLSLKYQLALAKGVSSPPVNMPDFVWQGKGIFEIITADNFDEYINKPIGKKFLRYLDVTNASLASAVKGRDYGGIAGLLGREDEEELLTLFNQFHIKHTRYAVYVKPDNFTAIFASPYLAGLRGVLTRGVLTRGVLTRGHFLKLLEAADPFLSAKFKKKKNLFSRMDDDAQKILCVYLNQYFKSGGKKIEIPKACASVNNQVQKEKMNNFQYASFAPAPKTVGAGFIPALAGTSHPSAGQSGAPSQKTKPPYPLMWDAFWAIYEEESAVDASGTFHWSAEEISDNLDKAVSDYFDQKFLNIGMESIKGRYEPVQVLGEAMLVKNIKTGKVEIIPIEKLIAIGIKNQNASKEQIRKETQNDINMAVECWNIAYVNPVLNSLKGGRIYKRANERFKELYGVDFGVATAEDIALHAVGGPSPKMPKMTEGAKKFADLKQKTLEILIKKNLPAGAEIKITEEYTLVTSGFCAGKQTPESLRYNLFKAKKLVFRDLKTRKFIAVTPEVSNANLQFAIVDSRKTAFDNFDDAVFYQTEKNGGVNETFAKAVAGSAKGILWDMPAMIIDCALNPAAAYMFAVNICTPEGLKGFWDEASAKLTSGDEFEVAAWFSMNLAMAASMGVHGGAKLKEMLKKPKGRIPALSGTGERVMLKIRKDNGKFVTEVFVDEIKITDAVLAKAITEAVAENIKLGSKPFKMSLNIIGPDGKPDKVKNRRRALAYVKPSPAKKPGAKSSKKAAAKKKKTGTSAGVGARRGVPAQGAPTPGAPTPGKESAPKPGLARPRPAPSGAGPKIRTGGIGAVGNDARHADARLDGAQDKLYPGQRRHHRPPAKDASPEFGKRIGAANLSVEEPGLRGNGAPKEKSVKKQNGAACEGNPADKAEKKQNGTTREGADKTPISEHDFDLVIMREKEKLLGKLRDSGLTPEEKQNLIHETIEKIHQDCVRRLIDEHIELNKKLADINSQIEKLAGEVLSDETLINMPESKIDQIIEKRAEEYCLKLSSEKDSLAEKIRPLLKSLQDFYLQMMKELPERKLSPKEKAADDMILGNIPETQRKSLRELLLSLPDSIIMNIRNAGVLIRVNERVTLYNDALNLIEIQFRADGDYKIFRQLVVHEIFHAIRQHKERFKAAEQTYQKIVAILKKVIAGQARSSKILDFIIDAVRNSSSRQDYRKIFSDDFFEEIVGDLFQFFQCPELMYREEAGSNAFFGSGYKPLSSEHPSPERSYKTILQNQEPALFRLIKQLCDELVGSKIQPPAPEKPASPSPSCGTLAGGVLTRGVRPVDANTPGSLPEYKNPQGPRYHHKPAAEASPEFGKRIGAANLSVEEPGLRGNGTPKDKAEKARQEDLRHIFNTVVRTFEKDIRGLEICKSLAEKYDSVAVINNYIDQFIRIYDSLTLEIEKELSSENRKIFMNLKNKLVAEHYITILIKVYDLIINRLLNESQKKDIISKIKNQATQIFPEVAAKYNELLSKHKNAGAQTEYAAFKEAVKSLSEEESLRRYFSFELTDGQQRRFTQALIKKLTQLEESEGKSNGKKSGPGSAPRANSSQEAFGKADSNEKAKPIEKRGGIIGKAKTHVENARQALRGAARDFNAGVQSLFGDGRQFAIAGGGDLAGGGAMHQTVHGAVKTRGGLPQKPTIAESRSSSRRGSAGLKTILIGKVKEFLTPEEVKILDETPESVINETATQNNLLRKTFIAGAEKPTRARANYFMEKLLQNKLLGKLADLNNSITAAPQQSIKAAIKAPSLSKVQVFKNRVRILIETIKSGVFCFNRAQILEMTKILESIENIYDGNQVLEKLELLAGRCRVTPRSVKEYIGNIREYLHNVLLFPEELNLQFLFNLIASNIIKLYEEGEIGAKDMANFVEKFYDPEFAEYFMRHIEKGADIYDIKERLMSYICYDKAEREKWRYFSDLMMELNQKFKDKFKDKGLTVAIDVHGGRNFLYDIKNLSRGELDFLMSQIESAFLRDNLPEMLQKDYFGRDNKYKKVNEKHNPHQVKSLRHKNFGGLCELREGSLRIKGEDGPRVWYSAVKNNGQIYIYLYRYFENHRKYMKALYKEEPLFPPTEPLHDSVAKSVGDIMMANSIIRKLRRLGASDDKIREAGNRIYELRDDPVGLKECLDAHFPSDKYTVIVFFDGLHLGFEIAKKEHASPGGEFAEVPRTPREEAASCPRNDAGFTAPEMSQEQDAAQRQTAESVACQNPARKNYAYYKNKLEEISRLETEECRAAIEEFKKTAPPEFSARIFYELLQSRKNDQGKIVLEEYLRFFMTLNRPAQEQTIKMFKEYFAGQLTEQTNRKTYALVNNLIARLSQPPIVLRREPPLDRNGIGADFGSNRPKAARERGAEVDLSHPVDPANPPAPGGRAGFARIKKDIFAEGNGEANNQPAKNADPRGVQACGGEYAQEEARLAKVKTVARKAMEKHKIPRLNRLSNVLAASNASVAEFAVDLREFLIKRRMDNPAEAELDYVNFFGEIITKLKTVDPACAAEFQSALVGRPIRRIIFVCGANLQRSIGAEYIMRELLKRDPELADIPFVIESAGAVVDVAGNPQNGGKTAVGFYDGSIPVENHTRKQFEFSHISRYDIVFVTKDTAKWWEIYGVIPSESYIKAFKQVITVDIPSDLITKEDAAAFDNFIHYIKSREKINRAFSAGVESAPKKNGTTHDVGSIHESPLQGKIPFGELYRERLRADTPGKKVALADKCFENGEYNLACEIYYEAAGDIYTFGEGKRAQALADILAKLKTAAAKANNGTVLGFCKDIKDYYEKLKRKEEEQSAVPETILDRNGIGADFGANRPKAARERGAQVDLSHPVDPANPPPPGNHAGFAKAKNKIFQPETTTKSENFSPEKISETTDAQRLGILARNDGRKDRLKAVIENEHTLAKDRRMAQKRLDEICAKEKTASDAVGIIIEKNAREIIGDNFSPQIRGLILSRAIECISDIKKELTAVHKKSPEIFEKIIQDIILDFGRYITNSLINMKILLYMKKYGNVYAQTLSLKLEIVPTYIKLKLLELDPVQIEEFCRYIVNPEEMLIAGVSIIKDPQKKGKKPAINIHMFHPSKDKIEGILDKMEDSLTEKWDEDREKADKFRNYLTTDAEWIELADFHLAGSARVRTSDHIELGVLAFNPEAEELRIVKTFFKEHKNVFSRKEKIKIITDILSDCPEFRPGELRELNNQQIDRLLETTLAVAGARGFRINENVIYARHLKAISSVVTNNKVPGTFVPKEENEESSRYDEYLYEEKYKSEDAEPEDDFEDSECPEEENLDFDDFED